MHGSRVRYIVLRTESSELQQPDAAHPRKLIDALAQTIVGQQEAVEALVLALIAGGHVLLEGAPGLAKTLACSALARALDASFKRIQFTPDLLPSDIVGMRIFDQRESIFTTSLGPIFANIVLADEINRAPAKVQSALLEAMQERQVTIGGETHALPEPCTVVATMNPYDFEGTYALPLAQMDRFLVHVRLTYPSPQEEYEILDRFFVEKTGALESVMPLDAIRSWRTQATAIRLDERLKRHIVDLVVATRGPKELPPNVREMCAYIDYGASPRATLAIARLSRAKALLDNRDVVVPRDVHDVAPLALRHRIGFNYRVQTERIDTDTIINTIIAAVANL